MASVTWIADCNMTGIFGQFLLNVLVLALFIVEAWKSLFTSATLPFNHLQFKLAAFLPSLRACTSTNSKKISRWLFANHYTCSYIPPTLLDPALHSGFATLTLTLTWRPTSHLQFYGKPLSRLLSLHILLLLLLGRRERTMRLVRSARVNLLLTTSPIEVIFGQYSLISSNSAYSLPNKPLTWNRRPQLRKNGYPPLKAGDIQELSSQK